MRFVILSIRRATNLTWLKPRGKRPEDAAWRAGRSRCTEVYVLGVIEKEDRKAQLPVAAKETFKYAVIRKDKKNKIIQELEKLISKS